MASAAPLRRVAGTDFPREIEGSQMVALHALASFSLAVPQRLTSRPVLAGLTFLRRPAGTDFCVPAAPSGFRAAHRASRLSRPCGLQSLTPSLRTPAGHESRPAGQLRCALRLLSVRARGCAASAEENGNAHHPHPLSLIAARVHRRPVRIKAKPCGSAVRSPPVPIPAPRFVLPLSRSRPPSPRTAEP